MSNNTNSKQGKALNPIYVASRASIPERGAMWRQFRSEGVQITSSWIDEDEAGATWDSSELWTRIANEIRAASALVLYAECDDFPLKGAFIEAGFALGMGKPVIVCLPGLGVLPRNYRPIGSWIAHPLVTRCDDINAAVRLATRSRASVAALEEDAVGSPCRLLGYSYVAWCRYTYDESGGIQSIKTCDSDAKGAFKVYRQPVSAAVPETPVGGEVDPCEAAGYHVCGRLDSEHLTKGQK